MDATIEELREVGFAAMTMGSVARRAGAGKISVYRRWPDRVELAMAAAYRLIGEPPELLEPTTLREELLVVLRHAAQQMSGPAGEALRGIISESIGTDDVRIAELSKGNGARLMREVVRRAVARGEPVDPDPALIRLQAPGAILQHHLLTHGPPIRDAFVVSVVDEIAVPLLGRNG